MSDSTAAILQVLKKRMPMRDLLRILRLFVTRYRRASAVVLACLLVANILEGLGILALLPLLNVATGQAAGANPVAAALTTGLGHLGLPPSLGVLLAAIVVIVILKSALTYIGMKYVGYTMARVQTDLRLDFIRSMLAARWSYFTSQPAGRLTNAVSTEPERAASAILYAIMLLTLMIQGAVYITAAVLISPVVALGAIVTGFGMITLLSWFTRLSRSAGEAQTHFLNALLGRFVDAIQGIKPIKAMALESRLIPLLERETRGLLAALQRQVVATTAVRALQEPIATLVLAGGLFVCLTRFSVPIIDVMVLALVFWRAVQTLGGFQKTAQSMVSQESALWSLRDATTSAQKQAERVAGAAPPRLVRDLVFDRVVFAHADRAVLDQLSLTVPANTITAVVGPSGTGKTTVADLALGLYRPQSGDIRVDGVSLSTVDLHAWRELIGYVPQETALFAGTILTNVTLGDAAFSDTDAEAALRAAGAWDFVRALPQGLNTPTGERGQHLSGGQRQRIAVARAMIRKPRLLVLDEATTALDPETEQAICATLRDLAREVTILAISHQPAIVQAADCVFRIEDGRAVIAERGDARAIA
jgi:ATP-binding cassette subfamily C protein